MSAMTKKEWMEYIEKTWDAAQKEAWSEPQFECPRCGHCCHVEVYADDTSQERVDEKAKRKHEWVGLTLKEILINRHLIDWTSEWSYLEFAREIERALKEKNT